MTNSRWLLLLHQIPPHPAYFRAKVLRRLERAGALPVKNSVYLLPDCDEAREDFQWICQEINDQGGSAWIYGAELLEGWSDEKTRDAFRDLIAPQYKELISEAIRAANTGSPAKGLPRLTRRVAEIKRIDYFESPLRRKLETLMEKMEQQARANAKETARSGRKRAGGVWVTRRGIKVDRIGSAWLIQRFIDPRATFRFIDPERYTHRLNETRFDMVGAEFGHEGDMCTFEVLLAAHRLRKDRALVALSEMVHDIDLKDDHYQRPATTGLARMIEGLAANASSDEVRLTQGAIIFESLYNGLRK
jgi:hypothetical protein